MGTVRHAAPYLELERLLEFVNVNAIKRGPVSASSRRPLLLTHRVHIHQ